MPARSSALAAQNPGRIFHLQKSAQSQPSALADRAQGPLQASGVLPPPRGSGPPRAKGEQLLGSLALRYVPADAT